MKKRALVSGHVIGKWVDKGRGQRARGRTYLYKLMWARRTHNSASRICSYSVVAVGGREGKGKGGVREISEKGRRVYVGISNGQPAITGPGAVLY